MGIYKMTEEIVDAVCTCGCAVSIDFGSLLAMNGMIRLPQCEECHAETVIRCAMEDGVEMDAYYESRLTLHQTLYKRLVDAGKVAAGSRNIGSHLLMLAKPWDGVPVESPLPLIIRNAVAH